MHVVADASVLVEALTDAGNQESAAVRRWLAGLVGPDDLHVVRNLTTLEVENAMRRLAARGLIAPDDALAVVQRLVELPARRLDVTQAMTRRIWELRANHSVYDAAYMALAERLESELRSPVAVATTDARMGRGGPVPCTIRVFPD